MIVTLGCSSVLSGGNVEEIAPLSHSYGRLMKTLDVYNELDGKNGKVQIICTGHKGSAADMKKFLIRKGIEKDKIICESFARNTIENCIFSYKIINEIFHGKILNIYLVTDDYHMERAKIIFQFFGYLLKAEQKNLILRPSFMLQYIRDPSVIQLEQIKNSYEKDKLIIKETLDKSLKFYLSKFLNMSD